MLAGDSTRTVVIEKVMADGPAMQEMMSAIAKDQTVVDGILNLAVQDSMMKSHLMGVLQGMNMMAR